ncbi:MAG: hypothetical protein U1A77_02140 [Pirellulales bacterium]
MSAPESLIDRWRTAMRRAGVTHVVGVPDSVTAGLFALPIADEHGPRVVTVCREGEAFAIAAGLWASGARPLVWIQSTGLFESGDSLRSVSAELQVPLDVVIGWRGHSGKLNAGHADTARDWLEPTLFAWRVNYRVAASAEASELEEWLRQDTDRLLDLRALLIPQ